MTVAVLASAHGVSCWVMTGKLTHEVRVPELCPLRIGWTPLGEYERPTITYRTFRLQQAWSEGDQQFGFYEER